MQLLLRYKLSTLRHTRYPCFLIILYIFSVFGAKTN
uniref:Uncharacterized protein n=1 Tax=virus sp. ctiha2 TaxID=2827299 RepID=A0A8S5RHG5_9VIRU|nr:MAG TPA: hypothetical protein [virus sp. ctiha2]